MGVKTQPAVYPSRSLMAVRAGLGRSGDVDGAMVIGRGTKERRGYRDGEGLADGEPLIHPHSLTIIPSPVLAG